MEISKLIKKFIEEQLNNFELIKQKLNNESAKQLEKDKECEIVWQNKFDKMRQNFDNEILEFKETFQVCF